MNATIIARLDTQIERILVRKGIVSPSPSSLQGREERKSSVPNHLEGQDHSLPPIPRQRRVEDICEFD